MFIKSKQCRAGPEPRRAGHVGACGWHRMPVEVRPIRLLRCRKRLCLSPISRQTDTHLPDTEIREGRNFFSPFMRKTVYLCR